MKLLVVGIDGLDREIVMNMPMPFLKEQFSTQTALELKEDLWSRGWPKILCGSPAAETGAFYTKPKLSSEFAFTKSFGTKDYEGQDPVWKVTDEMGLRSAFMHFPTTYPACAVNGFMVSGAGGGVKPKKYPPEAAVTPPEIIEKIDDPDYRWDVRISSADAKTADQFFRETTSASIAKANVFIKLCRSENIDVGFLCDRSPVVTQNLARHDIDLILRNQLDDARMQSIQNVYENLDKWLRKLITELNPEAFVIVSDHGSASYLSNVNVNAFLSEAGYLKNRASILRHIDRLLYRATSLLSRRLNKIIQSPEPRRQSPLAQSFDMKRSVAFGSRYIPGIYVNDSRFGGDCPADGRIVEEIIDTFNSHAEAKELSISARPYRKNMRDSSKSDLLPDIWIDHPDTVFFVEHGPFVSKNPGYTRVDSLEHINASMISGIKGHKPVALLSRNLERHIPTDTTKDLTQVYRVIRAYLEEFRSERSRQES